MRNPSLTHLREAVRDEIVNAFESVGFAKPRHIARLVCAANPGAIADIGSRLAEDALTDMARRELKSNSEGRECHLQMRLPGVPDHVTKLLPPAISIPSSEDGDGDAVIYKPLAQVTFDELKVHLELLSNQITADIRRHRALTELHDMALARGAVGENCVFDVLGTTESVEAEVA